MIDIHVNIGVGYNVSIASGLLRKCGTIAAQSIKPCRAAIISDGNVAPLYLKTAAESFEAAGFDTFTKVIEAGEGYKTLETLSDILEFFAESRLTRGDIAVALGGGVVGDITGFAAGVYLRGISYVALPTTLLAAVDSSVGGKTAIDLRAGKNLAGLFIQPKAVICDTDCLATLTSEQFSCGTAEAIKTGILSGRGLFSSFLSGKRLSREYADGNENTGIDEIIAKCVEYKASVVERDEHEMGERKLLNLGHTAAHSIEKLSGYEIPHGMAVAMGLGIIARAACNMGFCNRNCRDEIISALEGQGLPTTTEYSAEELSEAAMVDKKRSGDNITLVLPRDIGDCKLVSVHISELREIMSRGLK